ncbi:WD40 repeat domain-containing protein, partial [Salmonella sp. s54836]|uniref:WD40 repeat domain-containing protein n=1 Tax=Salmonella sp. s54836 TaxID=3159673 RepID=UPI00397EFC85
MLDTTKKSHLRKITGHSKQVHNVCFTLDGLGIMSCSDDAVVKQWDLTTGEHRHDGQLLVASDDSGLIHVLDTTKKSHLRKITGHSKQV